MRELPYWGIFPLSAGSPAVFQAAGLRLLVIVKVFGMLYWGIFPYMEIVGFILVSVNFS